MDEIKNINIVVTDDHLLFRKGLKTLLREIGFTGRLFGAANGQELIELLNTTEPVPDLVLLDINMPVMDGVAATEIIRKSFCQVKIIVLTMESEEQMILHMIEKGVNGYLLKNCEPEELEMAIKMVIEKDFYFGHDIAGIIRNSLMHKTKPTNEFHRFTQRELEVLHLICKEFTGPEIAEKLNLSPRTIETHRKNLIEKSGVKNLAGLIVYAIKHELVKI